MHLQVEHDPGGLTVHLEPGEAEPVTRRSPLVRRSAFYSVDLPPGSVHPDLLVLSAVLTAQPWINPRTPLTCSVAGSAQLAAGLRTGARVRLATVDPELPPRTAPDDARPGLCLSGGTDSVASLALLPSSTHSYHLRRRPPRDDVRGSLLDSRAAEQSCAEVRRQGHPVTVVDSDVEHLRDPIGFPHDFTTAVPLLLHADAHGLDSVAWGAPLEATYRLQRGRFRDYVLSPFIAGWGPAFQSVGLDVFVPVAGVSELVTGTIVHQHPLGQAAQSCVRGPALGQPCGRCDKCARKRMISGAVTGSWPTGPELDRLWSRAEPRQHLLADPIKVEPVVAHTAHRYLAQGGDSEVLRLVVAKTGPDPLPWLTRSYEPALELVPDRYRQQVRERLHAYAPPMSRQEEAAVRAYDVVDGAHPGRGAAQRDLQTWMADHPADGRVTQVLRRWLRTPHHRLRRARARWRSRVPRPPVA